MNYRFRQNLADFMPRDEDEPTKDRSGPNLHAKTHGLGQNQLLFWKNIPMHLLIFLAVCWEWALSFYTSHFHTPWQQEHCFACVAKWAIPWNIIIPLDPRISLSINT